MDDQNAELSDAASTGLGDDGELTFAASGPNRAPHNISQNRGTVDNPRPGDVNPETGLFFWGKRKWGQCWLTKDKFHSYRLKSLVNSKNQYRKNKKRRLETGYLWRKKNRKKSRDIHKRWLKKRRKNDPIFRIQMSIRSSLGKSIGRRGGKMGMKMKKIIGCDKDILFEHLSSQFLPGMSWENRGKFGWHIDHKIPLSLAKNREQIIRLWHYSNLRPMWWRENIIKGNSILPEFAHLLPFDMRRNC